MIFRSCMLIQNNYINVGAISHRFMGSRMALSIQPKIKQDEDHEDNIVRKAIYYREENEIIDTSDANICRESKDTKLLALAKDMISQVFETDSHVFDKKKQ